MSGRRLGLWLCLVCVQVTGNAMAAVTHDPALVWRTLHTAHFRVHFHDDGEPLARRTAALAEHVHERLVPLIGWTPADPVDIVVDDRQDLANGYAAVFPSDHLTILVTAPDEIGGLEDHDGWLELLLTHEYVHILHLDRANGAPAVLRRIFGRNVWLFPNALQPRWLIEGLATWHETDRVRGIGRGQSSYFDMLMRMEVANGVKPVRQVNQWIASWPAGHTPYLYGVAFFDFVEARHGVQGVRRLVNAYSDNLVPFRINGTSRAALGGNYDQLWPRFEEYLRERHGTRLDHIRQAGVVAGERLTRDGYYGGMARALPGGDVVYLRVDGRNEPALLRRRPDGTVRCLAAVPPSSHLAVHPRAGALLAQPEIHRNSNLYYDLYRVDLDSGRKQRLTHAARYRFAAWSPDGSRILAVHNGGDRSALHLLDGAGRQLEVLWVGEPDVVLSAPDWSPDGMGVALAVWRPRHGWNLERFLLAERRFEALTQDGTIEAQPAHTPDGRALLFSSDHGGVYNLRRLDLASGNVTTLTNVEGGAFYPSQAEMEGPIIYSGFDASGFDVYRLDAPASLATPPAAPRPASAAPAAPALTGPVAIADYSPFDGLRPRWWFPHLTVDSRRTEVGAMTSAWDPLLRHIYYLDAAYDFSNEWVTGSFDYLYDRYLPMFKLHASRYSKLYLDADDEPERVTTSDTLLGEIMLPFLRQRRSFTARAAAYTVRDDDGWTAAGVTPQPERRDNVLGYALTYDSTRRYPRSVSRSHGVFASVTAETSDALAGSDYSGEVYTADARVLLPLGHEHVLAVRAAYGWGSGQSRAFVLGGSRSAGASPLPLDPALVYSPFNQRDFALRGYDSGQPGLTGRRMLTAAAEWRFPLARMERGFMAPPLALHQLSGSVFAETGDAWQNGRHPDELVTGAGAEIHAETFVFYDLPLHLRLGYAYGFAEGGGSHAYLQLGASF
jgi:hypothetical protein